MIVAIHQPNFMPWYPFFQKMQQADVFVIMVYCQFEKNGYQNRFNLSDGWRTMSVYRGLDIINQKRYVNPQVDWKKIKMSLPQYSEQLEVFDDCIEESLVGTNVAIIRRAVQLLGLDTKIVIDNPTDLSGTERLVEICADNAATSYLAGISGRNYLDEGLFVKKKSLF